MMKRLILAAALFAALAGFDAGAQSMGPPPGHPHGAPVPSAEMLATSDLTPAQQADVRRILMQKRDALDAAQTKVHTQMEALHKQMRDDHERIETQTSDQLRKALGDDAYKRYAEWSLRNGHGPMFGHDGAGMHGMHMREPHGGTPTPPGAGGGKPDADGE
jgi:Asp-tRNA(Asn)/Glu-tRNA(Gln) amidotransferase A subunit family amidase